MNTLIHVENRSGKVTLDESVNPDSTKRLLDEMEKLYGKKAVLENMKVGEFYASDDEALDILNIDIHSPGGSVFDGWRMHNAILGMRERGVKVIATVNSLAASMATVVAIAADEVHIVPNGRMMIHDASTLAVGTAAELRKQADLAESLSAEIAGAYAAKTGKTAEEMRALMLEETWLTANEAVELGLADKIVTVKKAEKVDTKTKAMAITELFKSVFGVRPDRAEMQDKYESALSEIADFEKETADLRASVETLTAEKTTAAEYVAQLEGSVEALKTEKAELQTKLDETAASLFTAGHTIATLQAEVDDIPNKVSAQAQVLLAASGHQPLAVGNGSGDAPVNILDKFSALQGAEQAQFYKEHRKEILKAMKQLA